MSHVIGVTAKGDSPSEGLDARVRIKEQDGDHVIVGGKWEQETAWCTRCGEGLPMQTPQPFEDFLKTCQEFIDKHKACTPGWKEPNPATPEEWLAGRDTGASSRTLCSALLGRNYLSPRAYDAPHDPDDFGRCYRFVNLFPHFRDRIHEVVNLCPEWEPFIREWDKLVVMYESSYAKVGPHCSYREAAADTIMFDFMQSLRKA